MFWLYLSPRAKYHLNHKKNVNKTFIKKSVDAHLWIINYGVYPNLNRQPQTTDFRKYKLRQFNSY